MAPQKPKAGKSGAAAKPRDSKPAKAKGKKAPVRKDDQIKTQGAANVKPKKKQYSEQELGIPQLNMITPAGVQKPKGKKKGKVFVDDQESMMTILAMVNAEKEGQIESKMMKARQLEEIREARHQEMESRREEKQSKLNKAKDAMRKGKKKAPRDSPEEESSKSSKASKPNKKRVSFG